MSKEPLNHALHLLLEADLRDADAAYAAAGTRRSHALIVLFEASGKTIADFDLEQQQVIEDSYLMVYGQPRST